MRLVLSISVTCYRFTCKIRMRKQWKREEGSWKPWSEWDESHYRESIRFLPVTTVSSRPPPHGHNDHINAAVELADAVNAPIWLHPDDGMLWDVVHPDRRIDDPLQDGLSIGVAGDELTILHTPGHSPGGCCIHVPTLSVVFSGDTLFNGGPGATGRSFSDRGTLVDSIRSRLFVLDSATEVHTGHGESTTVGAEADRLGRPDEAEG